jgi:hypothetical protein
MSKRILFVDDEVNLLQALERRFRKEFEIQTAPGPELGLNAVAEAGPPAEDGTENRYSSAGPITRPIPMIDVMS